MNEGEHEQVCTSKNRPGPGRTSMGQDNQTSVQMREQTRCERGPEQDGMSSEYEDAEERCEQGHEQDGNKMGLRV
jgi:hypothetical protein